MTGPINWRKSSYSEGGDGNTCVEIAPLRSRVAIRDSKNPTHGTLTIPLASFTALVRSLKTPIN
ncbi:DUF397 domain-containing protein [Streptomyces sp. NPDC049936]|uniref:DUF397 domain-containing protein n=1 Tax=Streptomyces sp. NPDC049936 TaxID=3365599 RepID=UPI0037B19850